MLIKCPANSPDPILSEASLRVSSQQNRIGLWSRGYIANQVELINRFGLSRQSSSLDLLSFLFQKMGAAASARLVAGPCSWVVWDSARKLLFVVSDRMGLAPLYCAEFTRCLWLADDIDILLENAGISRRVNPNAIVAKIHLLPLLEDETLYQGIYKLTPGTVWTCANDYSSHETYWQAELQPVLRLKNDQEYAEALRALLVQVVDEHVPHKQFSLTLSSGMDSSSIAGALRLARPNDRIPCLGCIMPELPESNEEEGIRATSEKLDLDLTTLQADQFWPLKADGLYGKLPQTVTYQAVWIAAYLELQKQGIRVLVGGDMGDQCFGSSLYSHSDLLLSLHWHKLVKQIRDEWRLGYIYPRNWETLLRWALRPLKNYIGGLLPLSFPFRKRASSVSWLHPAQRVAYERAVRANRPPFKVGLPARVQRWWKIIHPGAITFTLPHNELAHKFGIELRYPLWDHRILEFALGLPAEQTYYSGIQKFILRNAMRGVLPDTVVDLPWKILPISLHHRGMRERSIEQARHLMTNMRLAEMGYVLPAELQSVYQRYLGGETDDSRFFFTLMLESQVRAWV